MMASRKRRPRILLALSLNISLGFACTALCLAVSGAAAPPATSPAGATTRKGFVPAFKAIAYYDDSCRRCHGPQGSFYGPELGKGLTDKQLIKIVDDMANGPGQS